MKKKTISAILAVVLVMTSSIPVFATPNQEVLQNQQEYEKLTAKIDEVTGKIYALSEEIEPLLVTIENNEAQMNEIKVELNNTEKEIESTQKEITKTEEVLGKRVRELYKSGGQGSYLMLLFSADSFNDLIFKIESTSRLVGIDKKIVNELLVKQQIIDEKIASLDQKNKELASINEENQKNLETFEDKKLEQEKLLAQAKVEQDVFDRDYLSVSERKLVEYQIGLIRDSASTLHTLNSAISQLKDIRDNQIKSSIVIEEINSNIENAKVKVAELEATLEVQTIASATPIVNRGEATGSFSSIIDYAYGYLGTPYISAGTTPNPGFDCSGFVGYVYRNVAGVSLPRDTWGQMGVGAPISYDELQVGDIVFTYGGGHVGIYVGGGSYIHSSQPGDVVKVSPVSSFHTARRVL